MPERDPFRVYGVNVILAHNHEDTSPVIFETTPTYANLFGTIQRTYDARGGWTSDFMDLRAGSLLRADGGFLIMYSIEALSEPGVWRALKRTLNHNRLEIQPFETFYPFTTTALKPEPIEINVKVILIGDRNLYELLYEYEEDFRKIFKVRVEFDEEMAMSDGVIEEYAGRIRTLSEKESLFPFDRGAFAAILEHGVRKAGRRNESHRALCGYCGSRARSALRCRGCRRKCSPCSPRARGARLESRAAQPNRNAHPRNDGRRHAARKSAAVRIPVRSTV